MLLVNPYPATIFFLLKMLSAFYVYCKYSSALQVDLIMEANNMDSDQTAPKGQKELRGSNFDIFLLSLEGREDPSEYFYKWAIIDPPAKRHLNGILLAADNGPKLNAGLVVLWFFKGSRPVLLRNPIFFFDVSGGSGPLSPPSGSAHEHCLRHGR